MDRIIKNGLIVASNKSYKADIFIQNGKISAIGEDLQSVGAEIYDASGCKVFAGFIDAHTHLDMDTGTAITADDFHSGTRAAIVGGTTTIVDFATQNKGETLKSALANWHNKADNKSSCDYAFHMAITDWNENVSKELDEMGKEGVTSFKLYLAYDNLRVTDGELYQVLKRVGDIGGIVGAHCENGDLVNELVRENLQNENTSPHFHPLSRPDFVEAEAVSRYCYIAKAADVPINIVHLSTKMALDEALNARARGQKVYIESCPHYFILDDSIYDLPDFEGAKYVCSPPMRKKSDQLALWDAVAKNQIDTISTDHCSFDFDGQKTLGKDDFSKIPNGMPGIEHRPAIMHTYGVCTGKMTDEQMAAMLSENTAKLFGMYPQKGVLAVGSDADLTIWDSEYEGVITAKHMEQKVDYTPYEGMKIIGRAKVVFLRGNKIAENGEIISEHMGKYIPRGKSIY